jgi:hypothetical protein
VRLWHWVKLYWYRLLAACFHVQARRCHELKALAQERRFRRLEILCVAKQAQALKGLTR